jgi:hypothetical protein
MTKKKHGRIQSRKKITKLTLIFQNKHQPSILLIFRHRKDSISSQSNHQAQP